MQVKCPNCESVFDPGIVVKDGQDLFCSNCGRSFAYREGSYSLVCPKCGERYPDNYARCPKCCEPLVHKGDPIRKCPSCGEIYLAVHSTCPKCGTQNPTPVEGSEDSDANLNGYVCTACGSLVRYPTATGFRMGYVWGVLLLLALVGFLFSFLLLFAVIAIGLVCLIVAKCSSVKHACSNCGRTDCLIPLNSPKGQEVYRQMVAAEGQEKDPSTGNDIKDRLAKLEHLKSAGLISDAEYHERRGKILDTL